MNLPLYSPAHTAARTAVRVPARRLGRRITNAVAVALVGVTVAACGSGSDFNDADVAFATEMIPHHAQAVTMAEMVDGKDVDPEVAELASDIEGAQAPEIETMSGWLEEWDEPVPDISDAASMGEMDMPGMMTSDDMADLESAQGEEFQTLWLEMMVAHHEGAVDMAQTEQSEGENQSAVDLAEEIETAQGEEIAVMEDLLAGS